MALPPIPCRQCGTTFTPRKTAPGRNPNVFCGSPCFKEHCLTRPSKRDIPGATKLCPGCNEVKPYVSFSRFWRHEKWQTLSRCTSCHSQRSRSLRPPLSQGGDQSTRKYYAATEDWKKRNPERSRLIRAAGYQVRKAIRRGEITRGKSCEQCGTSDKKVEAAHKDYALPLDIRWLCTRCHRIWDREFPKSRVTASSHK